MAAVAKPESPLTPTSLLGPEPHSEGWWQLWASLSTLERPGSLAWATPSPWGSQRSDLCKRAAAAWQWSLIIPSLLTRPHKSICAAALGRAGAGRSGTGRSGTVPADARQTVSSEQSREHDF